MTSISRLIIKAIAVLMTITAVHANDDEDHFAATTYGSFIHFTSVPNALFFFEDIEEDGCTDR